MSDAPIAKFYQRDKRWLVSIDKDYDVKRGDFVEVTKANGDIRLAQLQDEVLVGTKGTSAKSHFLAKDVTELRDQGYLVSTRIERCLHADGEWSGWKVTT